ncbi:MAG: putative metal-binding motif-containing protein [Deltaproteobacteria bacterium]|nr:putative metal-binding motif-containing protein [Deltaproteobacteria bacterium]
MSRVRGALFLSALTANALLGCSVLVQPDLSRLNGGDAGMQADSSVIEDTGAVDDVPVVTNPDVVQGCLNDCVDSIACTIDRCANNTCIHTPDDTRCGADRRCDPVMGCVAVVMPRCMTPADCNDNNPCTSDACTSNRCANLPVDADGDSAPARMVDGRVCPLGTDCDDNNRAIHPGAPEVCDNLDNNCDSRVDEGLMCMPPAPNATCATAAIFDLTSATNIEVNGDNSRGTSVVRSVCSMDGAPELWYSVVWPSNRDLVVDATGASDGVDPVVFVAPNCGSNPYVCNDDISARNLAARVYLRAESNVPGRRTAVIGVESNAASRAGAFRLRLRTQNQVSADCGAPFRVDEGGAVRSPAPGITATSRLFCGGMVGASDTYNYVGNRGNVGFRLSAGRLSQRRSCTETGACLSTMTINSDGDSLLTVEQPGGSYTLQFIGN